MMVPRNRARLTGMAVLVLTFIVGALVGAAALQVVRGDDPLSAQRAAGSRHEPDFLDQLGLSAEQRAAVDGILERRRVQMEVYRPLLRAIGDSARSELRAVLTPEQQVLEERYMAERRAHIEKRERKEDK